MKYNVLGFEKSVTNVYSGKIYFANNCYQNVQSFLVTYAFKNSLETPHTNYEQVDRVGNLRVMGAGHQSPRGGCPETGSKESRDKEMDTSIHPLNIK